MRGLWNKRVLAGAVSAAMAVATYALPANANEIDGGNANGAVPTQESGQTPQAIAAQAGTAYYVDCAATVSGDGSQSNPINNLETVSLTNWLPGDKILFKAGSECHGRLTIGDSTQADATDGSGTTKFGLDSGETDSPIIFSAYGDVAKDGMPKIIANTEHIAGREAVLITDAHDVQVSGLEIINKDADEADYRKYIRRGVAIMNHNNGEMSNITISDNYIHDVTGQTDEGGIQGGAAGVIMEVYSFTRLTLKKNKEGVEEWARNSSAAANSVDKNPSYFNHVTIKNNRIENVSRSGINAASDYKCREEMAWDTGCDASRRDLNPWTPSLNVLIDGNTIKHTAGDGIVTQESKGAIVQNNYVEDAANTGAGNNAGVWNWNTDDTLFQYNEVTDTKKIGNNDGTAWDFDYGTRNTVFQYNYSHDNAGGALLFCGCGDWKNAGVGTATGVTFRYNISINDGYSATECEGSENAKRVFFLAGVTDGSVYNNTIVMPKAKDGDTLTITGSGDGKTSALFANNVIIADSPLADESAKAEGTDSSTPHLNWTNNVFVGNDGTAWPDTTHNTVVKLADFLSDAGLTIDGLRNGGADQLNFASKYTAKAGRPIGSAQQKDYAGTSVPTFAAPDAGAFQKSSFDAADAYAKHVASIEGGKSEDILVPANATLRVQSQVKPGYRLVVTGPDTDLARRVGETATESTTDQTLYVRSSVRAGKLNIACEQVDGAADSGACTAVTVSTVEDEMFDGSFESVHGSGTMWSMAGTDAKGNRIDFDNGNSALKKLAQRSTRAQEGVVFSGDYSARLGQNNDLNLMVDTLNMRDLPVEPGATYTLGFWAIPGKSSSGDAAVTATVKYRVNGVDAGGNWAGYAKQLATAAAKAEAGKTSYASVTFTVPANADPRGAVWVSISQTNLAADANAYVDDVTLVKEGQPVTVYVDKSALQQLVDSVADKRESDYTPETWAGFATALEAARQTLENADATQSEVDDAAQKLQSAIDALAKVDGSGTVTPEPDPNKPTKPEQPSNPSKPNKGNPNGTTDNGKSNAKIANTGSAIISIALVFVVCLGVGGGLLIRSKQERSIPHKN